MLKPEVMCVPAMLRGRSSWLFAWCAHRTAIGSDAVFLIYDVLKMSVPCAMGAGPGQHFAEGGCSACWQVRGQPVTGREEAHATGEQTSC